MANFSVSPLGLTFDKVVVRGPIAGLYAAAQTLTFSLTNTSGSSVTITNYGFSTSTRGDAVTQPAGVYTDSDFSVVPTGGNFPVTVANNATQSFTVSYSPKRRGSGFGDVRSVLLTLFNGSVAITNGGQVLNDVGEVTNSSVPTPVVVGAGGGVIEEAFDNARVSPIFWSAGNVPAGGNGVANNVKGLTPSFTLGDLDTTASIGPLLFWNPGAALPTSNATSLTTPWTPRVIKAGQIGGYNGVTYVQPVPYDYGTPRGARSVQILVYFGGVSSTVTAAKAIDDTLKFDLTISAVVNVPSNPTLVTVATFPGLTYSNSSGLFIGGATGFDLQGLTLVATTTNITNAASTPYQVGALITG